MSSQTATRTTIIGRTDDFPSSGLRAVEVQGKKLLLAKTGDAIHCIAGACPHNGAPLVDGVLHGDTVICPWHKAAFDAGSGKCIEPPALEDLPAYAIEIIDGDIILGDEILAPKPSAKPNPANIAIIGAGAAGFSAAAELRAQNHIGQITLIDSSKSLPLDRTALSKAVLAGAKPLEKTTLKPEEFYKSHNITRHAGEVTSLDPATHNITFADGASLHYDTALIATGGTPKPLPFAGGDLKNVFLLRSAADAAHIIASAEHASHAVIIGTSFIGMEAAASLRERGLSVTVIGQDSAPFETSLGAQVGKVIQSLHEEHGVKFILGAKITKLAGASSVEAVELESGASIKADLVIAGLGIQPATAFIKGLSLEDDGSLAVTESLRAADHLYAAGDIAAFPLHGAGARIRVEHWRVAEQHGRIAARAMLGEHATFTATPYFWTMHFNKRLDYVGHAKGTDQTIIRGDLGAQKFIAYYIQHGKVAAAAGMNENQNIAAIIELLNRKSWTLDELHPPNASPLDVLQKGSS